MEFFEPLTADDLLIAQSALRSLEAISWDATQLEALRGTHQETIVNDDVGADFNNACARYGLALEPFAPFLRAVEAVSARSVEAERDPGRHAHSQSSDMPSHTTMPSQIESSAVDDLMTLARLIPGEHAEEAVEACMKLLFRSADPTAPTTAPVRATLLLQEAVALQARANTRQGRGPDTERLVLMEAAARTATSILISSPADLDIFSQTLSTLSLCSAMFALNKADAEAHRAVRVHSRLLHSTSRDLLHAALVCREDCVVNACRIESGESPLYRMLSDLGPVPLQRGGNPFMDGSTNVAKSLSDVNSHALLSAECAVREELESVADVLEEAQRPRGVESTAFDVWVDMGPGCKAAWFRPDWLHGMTIFGVAHGKRPGEIYVMYIPTPQVAMPDVACSLTERRTMLDAMDREATINGVIVTRCCTLSSRGEGTGLQPASQSATRTLRLSHLIGPENACDKSLVTDDPCVIRPTSCIIAGSRLIIHLELRTGASSHGESAMTGGRLAELLGSVSLGAFIDDEPVDEGAAVGHVVPVQFDFNLYHDCMVHLWNPTVILRLVPTTSLDEVCLVGYDMLRRDVAAWTFKMDASRESIDVSSRKFCTPSPNDFVTKDEEWNYSSVDIGYDPHFVAFKIGDNVVVSSCGLSPAQIGSDIAPSPRRLRQTVLRHVRSGGRSHTVHDVEHILPILPQHRAFSSAVVGPARQLPFLVVAPDGTLMTFLQHFVDSGDRGPCTLVIQKGEPFQGGLIAAQSGCDLAAAPDTRLTLDDAVVVALTGLVARISLKSDRRNVDTRAPWVPDDGFLAGSDGNDWINGTPNDFVAVISAVLHATRENVGVSARAVCLLLSILDQALIQLTMMFYQDKGSSRLDRLADPVIARSTILSNRQDTEHCSVLQGMVETLSVLSSQRCTATSTATESKTESDRTGEAEVTLDVLLHDLVKAALIPCLDIQDSNDPVCHCPSHLADTIAIKHAALLCSAEGDIVILSPGSKFTHRPGQLCRVMSTLGDNRRPNVTQAVAPLLWYRYACIVGFTNIARGVPSLVLQRVVAAALADVTSSKRHKEASNRPSNVSTIDRRADLLRDFYAKLTCLVTFVNHWVECSGSGGIRAALTASSCVLVFVARLNATNAYTAEQLRSRNTLRSAVCALLHTMCEQLPISEIRLRESLPTAERASVTVAKEIYFQMPRGVNDLKAFYGPEGACATPVLVQGISNACVARDGVLVHVRLPLTEQEANSLQHTWNVRVHRFHVASEMDADAVLFIGPAASAAPASSMLGEWAQASISSREDASMKRASASVVDGPINSASDAEEDSVGQAQVASAGLASQGSESSEAAATASRARIVAAADSVMTLLDSAMASLQGIVPVCKPPAPPFHGTSATPIPAPSGPSLPPGRMSMHITDIFDVHTQGIVRIPVKFICNRDDGTRDSGAIANACIVVHSLEVAILMVSAGVPRDLESPYLPSVIARVRRAGNTGEALTSMPMSSQVRDGFSGSSDGGRILTSLVAILHWLRREQEAIMSESVALRASAIALSPEAVHLMDSTWMRSGLDVQGKTPSFAKSIRAVTAMEEEASSVQDDALSSLVCTLRPDQVDGCPLLPLHLLCGFEGPPFDAKLRFCPWGEIEALTGVEYPADWHTWNSEQVQSFRFTMGRWTNASRAAAAAAPRLTRDIAAGCHAADAAEQLLASATLWVTGHGSAVAAIGNEENVANEEAVATLARAMQAARRMRRWMADKRGHADKSAYPELALAVATASILTLAMRPSPLPLPLQPISSRLDMSGSPLEMSLGRGPGASISAGTAHNDPFVSVVAHILRGAAAFITDPSLGTHGPTFEGDHARALLGKLIALAEGARMAMALGCGREAILCTLVDALFLRADTSAPVSAFPAVHGEDGVSPLFTSSPPLPIPLMHTLVRTAEDVVGGADVSDNARRCFQILMDHVQPAVMDHLDCWTSPNRSHPAMSLSRDNYRDLKKGLSDMKGSQSFLDTLLARGVVPNEEGRKLVHRVFAHAVDLMNDTNEYTSLCEHVVVDGVDTGMQPVCAVSRVVSNNSENVEQWTRKGAFYCGYRGWRGLPSQRSAPSSQRQGKAHIDMNVTDGNAIGPFLDVFLPLDKQHLFQSLEIVFKITVSAAETARALSILNHLDGPDRKAPHAVVQGSVEQHTPSEFLFAVSAGQSEEDMAYTQYASVDPLGLPDVSTAGAYRVSWTTATHATSAPSELTDHITRVHRDVADKSECICKVVDVGEHSPLLSFPLQSSLHIHRQEGHTPVCHSATVAAGGPWSAVKRVAMPHGVPVAVQSVKQGEGRGGKEASGPLHSTGGGSFETAVSMIVLTRDDLVRFMGWHPMRPVCRIRITMGEPRAFIGMGRGSHALYGVKVNVRDQMSRAMPSVPTPVHVLGYPAEKRWWVREVREFASRVRTGALCTIMRVLTGRIWRLPRDIHLQPWPMLLGEFQLMPSDVEVVQNALQDSAEILHNCVLPVSIAANHAVFLSAAGDLMRTGARMHVSHFSRGDQSAMLRVRTKLEAYAKTYTSPATCLPALHLCRALDDGDTGSLNVKDDFCCKLVAHMLLQPNGESPHERQLRHSALQELLRGNARLCMHAEGEIVQRLQVIENNDGPASPNISSDASAGAMYVGAWTELYAMCEAISYRSTESSSTVMEVVGSLPSSFPTEFHVGKHSTRYDMKDGLLHTRVVVLAHEGASAVQVVPFLTGQNGSICLSTQVCTIEASMLIEGSEDNSGREMDFFSMCPSVFSRVLCACADAPVTHGLHVNTLARATSLVLLRYLSTSSPDRAQGLTTSLSESGLLHLVSVSAQDDHDLHGDRSDEYGEEMDSHDRHDNEDEHAFRQAVELIRMVCVATNNEAEAEAEVSTSSLELPVPVQRHTSTLVTPPLPLHNRRRLPDESGGDVEDSTNVGKTEDAGFHNYHAVTGLQSQKKIDGGRVWGEAESTIASMPMAEQHLQAFGWPLTVTRMLQPARSAGRGRSGIQQVSTPLSILQKEEDLAIAARTGGRDAGMPDPLSVCVQLTLQLDARRVTAEPIVRLDTAQQADCVSPLMRKRQVVLHAASLSADTEEETVALSYATTSRLLTTGEALSALSSAASPSRSLLGCLVLLQHGACMALGSGGIGTDEESETLAALRQSLLIDIPALVQHGAAVLLVCPNADIAVVRHVCKRLRADLSPSLARRVLVLPPADARLLGACCTDLSCWAATLCPGSRVDARLPVTEAWAKGTILVCAPPPFAHWFRVAFDGLGEDWRRWVCWEHGGGRIVWGGATVLPMGWVTGSTVLALGVPPLSHRSSPIAVCAHTVLTGWAWHGDEGAAYKMVEVDGCARMPAEDDLIADDDESLERLTNGLALARVSPSAGLAAEAAGTKVQSGPIRPLGRADEEVEEEGAGGSVLGGKAEVVITLRAPVPWPTHCVLVATRVAGLHRAMAAWRASLAEQALVNAQDAHGKWYEARIMEASPAELRVRYCGWSPSIDPGRYDEVMHRESPRVQPPFTRIREWRRVQVGDEVETRDKDAVDTGACVLEVDTLRGRIRVGTGTVGGSGHPSATPLHPPLHDQEEHTGAWCSLADNFRVACHATHRRPRAWADVDREPLSARSAGDGEGEEGGFALLEQSIPTMRPGPLFAGPALVSSGKGGWGRGGVSLSPHEEEGEGEGSFPPPTAPPDADPCPVLQASLAALGLSLGAGGDMSPALPQPLPSSVRLGRDLLHALHSCSLDILPTPAPPAPAGLVRGRRVRNVTPVARPLPPTIDLAPHSPLSHHASPPVPASLVLLAGPPSATLSFSTWIRIPAHVREVDAAGCLLYQAPLLELPDPIPTGMLVQAQYSLRKWYNARVDRSGEGPPSLPSMALQHAVGGDSDPPNSAAHAHPDLALYSVAYEDGDWSPALGRERIRLRSNGRQALCVALLPSGYVEASIITMSDPDAWPPLPSPKLAAVGSGGGAAATAAAGPAVLPVPSPLAVARVSALTPLRTGGQWMHVAVTAAPGLLSVYVNGSCEGRTATDTLPRSSTVWVGGGYLVPTVEGDVPVPLAGGDRSAQGHAVVYDLMGGQSAPSAPTPEGLTQRGPRVQLHGATLWDTRLCDGEVLAVMQGAGWEGAGVVPGWPLTPSVDTMPARLDGSALFTSIARRFSAPAPAPASMTSSHASSSEVAALPNSIAARVAVAAGPLSADDMGGTHAEFVRDAVHRAQLAVAHDIAHHEHLIDRFAQEGEAQREEGSLEDFIGQLNERVYSAPRQVRGGPGHIPSTQGVDMTRRAGGEGDNVVVLSSEEHLRSSRARMTAMSHAHSALVHGFVAQSSNNAPHNWTHPQGGRAAGGVSGPVRPPTAHPRRRTSFHPLRAGMVPDAGSGDGGEASMPTLGGGGVALPFQRSAGPSPVLAGVGGPTLPLRLLRHEVAEAGIPIDGTMGSAYGDMDSLQLSEQQPLHEAGGLSSRNAERQLMSHATGITQGRGGVEQVSDAAESDAGTSAARHSASRVIMSSGNGAITRSSAEQNARGPGVLLQHHHLRDQAWPQIERENAHAPRAGRSSDPVLDPASALAALHVLAVAEIQCGLSDAIASAARRSRLTALLSTMGSDDVEVAGIVACARLSVSVGIAAATSRAPEPVVVHAQGTRRAGVGGDKGRCTHLQVATALVTPGALVWADLYDSRLPALLIAPLPRGGLGDGPIAAGRKYRVRILPCEAAGQAGGTCAEVEAQNMYVCLPAWSKGAMGLGSGPQSCKGTPARSFAANVVDMGAGGGGGQDGGQDDVTPSPSPSLLAVAAAMVASAPPGSTLTAMLSSSSPLRPALDLVNSSLRPQQGPSPSVTPMSARLGMSMGVSAPPAVIPWGSAPRTPPPPPQARHAGLKQVQGMVLDSVSPGAEHVVMRSERGKGANRGSALLSSPDKVWPALAVLTDNRFVTLDAFAHAIAHTHAAAAEADMPLHSSSAPMPAPATVPVPLRTLQEVRLATATINRVHTRVAKKVLARVVGDACRGDYEKKAKGKIMLARLPACALIRIVTDNSLAFFFNHDLDIDCSAAIGQHTAACTCLHTALMDTEGFTAVLESCTGLAAQAATGQLPPSCACISVANSCALLQALCCTIRCRRAGQGEWAECGPTVINSKLLAPATLLLSCVLRSIGVGSSRPNIERDCLRDRPRPPLSTPAARVLQVVTAALRSACGTLGSDRSASSPTSSSPSSLSSLESELPLHLFPILHTLLTDLADAANVCASQAGNKVVIPPVGALGSAHDASGPVSWPYGAASSVGTAVTAAVHNSMVRNQGTSSSLACAMLAALDGEDLPLHEEPGIGGHRQGVFLTSPLGVPVLDVTGVGTVQAQDAGAISPPAPAYAGVLSAGATVWPKDGLGSAPSSIEHLAGRLRLPAFASAAFDLLDTADSLGLAGETMLRSLGTLHRLRALRVAMARVLPPSPGVASSLLALDSALVSSLDKQIRAHLSKKGDGRAAFSSFPVYDTVHGMPPLEHINTHGSIRTTLNSRGVSRSTQVVRTAGTSGISSQYTGYILDTGGDGVVQSVQAPVLGLQGGDPESPQEAARLDFIPCPACAFVNRPGSRTCEVCAGMLPRPAAEIHASLSMQIQPASASLSVDGESKKEGEAGDVHRFMGPVAGPTLAAPVKPAMHALLDSLGRLAPWLSVHRVVEAVRTAADIARAGEGAAAHIARVYACHPAGHAGAGREPPQLPASSVSEAALAAILRRIIAIARFNALLPRAWPLLDAAGFSLGNAEEEGSALPSLRSLFSLLLQHRHLVLATYKTALAVGAMTVTVCQVRTVSALVEAGATAQGVESASVVPSLNVTSANGGPTWDFSDFRECGSIGLIPSTHSVAYGGRNQGAHRQAPFPVDASHVRDCARPVVAFLDSDVRRMHEHFADADGTAELEEMAHVAYTEAAWGRGCGLDLEHMPPVSEAVRVGGGGGGTARMHESSTHERVAVHTESLGAGVGGVARHPDEPLHLFSFVRGAALFDVAMEGHPAFMQSPDGQLDLDADILPPLLVRVEGLSAGAAGVRPDSPWTPEEEEEEWEIEVDSEGLGVRCRTPRHVRDRSDTSPPPAPTVPNSPALPPPLVPARAVSEVTRHGGASPGEMQGVSDEGTGALNAMPAPAPAPVATPSAAELMAEIGGVLGQIQRRVGTSSVSDIRVPFRELCAIVHSRLPVAPPPGDGVGAPHVGPAAGVQPMGAEAGQRRGVVPSRAREGGMRLMSHPDAPPYASWNNPQSWEEYNHGGAASPSSSSAVRASTSGPPALQAGGVPHHVYLNRWDRSKGQVEGGGARVPLLPQMLAQQAGPTSLPHLRTAIRGRPYFVTFVGEGGTDAGGLFSEALTACWEDALSWDMPGVGVLFLPSPNGRAGRGEGLDGRLPTVHVTRPAALTVTRGGGHQVPPAPWSTRLALAHVMTYLGRQCGVGMRMRLALPVLLPPLVWKILSGCIARVAAGQASTLLDVLARHRGALSMLEAVAAAWVQPIPQHGAGGGRAVPPGDMRVCVRDLHGVDDELERTLEREDEEGGEGMEMIPTSLPSLDGVHHITVPSPTPSTSRARLVLAIRVAELLPACAALTLGLCAVIPPSALALLSPAQLEMAIAGETSLDISALQRRTRYEGWTLPRGEDDAGGAAEFHPQPASHPTIQAFWATLRDFTPSQQEGFLRFVYARRRLPPSDMSWPHVFTIMRMGRSRPDESLPQGHTCSFQLDLPEYTHAAALRRALLTACESCNEYDLDGGASGLGPQT